MFWSIPETLPPPNLNGSPPSTNLPLWAPDLEYYWSTSLNAWPRILLVYLSQHLIQSITTSLQTHTWVNNTRNQQKEFNFLHKPSRGSITPYQKWHLLLVIISTSCLANNCRLLLQHKTSLNKSYGTMEHTIIFYLNITDKYHQNIYQSTHFFGIPHNEHSFIQAKPIMLWPNYAYHIMTYISLPYMTCLPKPTIPWPTQAYYTMTYLNLPYHDLPKHTIS